MLHLSSLQLTSLYASFLKIRTPCPAHGGRPCAVYRAELWRSRQRSDLLEHRQGLEILLQVMANETEEESVALGAGLALEPEAPELFQGEALSLAENEDRPRRKGSDPTSGAVGWTEEGASGD